ncbi:MAG: type I-G CRISPR-associated RAMP protein Csb1/Cas7g [Blastocatellia bacterium]|jgi:CRISPR-associated protein Csb1
MSNESNLNQYDSFIESTDWLKAHDLPIAITLEETLEPALGPEAIIFPPTFAVIKGTHPYQIDILDNRLTSQEAARIGAEANCCQIDGVGSQANRMESKFKEHPFKSLIPQVIVHLTENIAANLVDVGHRVADGAIRFSGLRDDVTKAILALKDSGNAAPMAQLAPTSLIFGFWDSRPNTTLFKFGRMLTANIHATNVELVKRSAQFNPAFDPAAIGLASEVPEEEGDQGNNAGKAADGKDPMSKLGLRHVPAVATHGGVRVYGQIVRRTQINLARLRSLAVTANDTIDYEATLRLRRYILGLSLVAGRVQPNYDLREGCLLHTRKTVSQLVYANGENQPFNWEIADSFSYAGNAATAFGVGPSREVNFNTKDAQQEVEDLKKGKKGKK